MPSYLKGDVVLVRYPFSDLSGAKVRPAIIVSGPHASQDLFIVPLTSRIDPLLAGEFVLDNWKNAGLNVTSAVKRGLYTVHQNLIVKSVGLISQSMPHVLMTLYKAGWHYEHRRANRTRERRSRGHQSSWRDILSRAEL